MVEFDPYETPVSAQETLRKLEQIPRMCCPVCSLQHQPSDFLWGAKCCTDCGENLGIQLPLRIRLLMAVTGFTSMIIGCNKILQLVFVSIQPGMEFYLIPGKTPFIVLTCVLLCASLYGFFRCGFLAVFRGRRPISNEELLQIRKSFRQK